MMQNQPHAPLPPIPPKQQTPWWANEKTVVRLLALFGLIITVLGAGYLVSLVADYDFLTPIVRIVLATILACVFLASSMLLWTRHAPPIISNGLFLTSAITFVLVLFSILFIYQWWPLWIGRVLLMVFTIGYFGLTRWWNKPILAIALGYGFIHAAYAVNDNVSAPVFIPGAFVGICLVINCFRDPQWNTAKLNAVAITAYGSLLLDNVFSKETLLISVSAIVSAVIVLALAQLDRSEQRVIQHAASSALMIFLLTFSWIGTTKPWVFWTSFIIVAIWFALCLYQPTDIKREERLVALTFAPIPLFFCSAANNLAPIHTWAFLLAYAAVLVWLMFRERHIAPWISWLVCVLLITGSITSYALNSAGNLYAPFEYVLFAIFFVVAGAAGCILWFKTASLATQYSMLLAFQLIHFCMLSLCTVGRLAFGDLGVYLTHACVTLTMVVLAALFFSQVIKKTRKIELQYSMFYLSLAVFKLMTIDVVVTNTLTRAIIYILSGVVVLIAVTMRSNRIERTTPNTTEGSETGIDPREAATTTA